MSIAAEIEKNVHQALTIHHLVIENESHMHSGPATDSHFKLALVADEFKGKRPVARHQLVYAAVSELMNNPIHALALHLYTLEEWQAQNGDVPLSPNCMGASKSG
ncbi:BolA family protein [Amphritea balenae]|uniref:BolA family transcriptional regulator n=1 Tax=Amphritea balenae TaxID=452629 RepID=A0A3P1SI63_9GAMM|nr:BolA family protein [Amphritea balenae]RRC96660.1 BolA family transcriptional regulator [Amphritea balenae]GGK74707.1 DNA-binding transcriptional regulator BolA [Amphritea balenae]